MPSSPRSERALGWPACASRGGAATAPAPPAPGPVALASAPHKRRRRVRSAQPRPAWHLHRLKLPGGTAGRARHHRTSRCACDAAAAGRNGLAGRKHRRQALRCGRAHLRPGVGQRSGDQHLFTPRHDRTCWAAGQRPAASARHRTRPAVHSAAGVVSHRLGAVRTSAAHRRQPERRRGPGPTRPVPPPNRSGTTSGTASSPARSDGRGPAARSARSRRRRPALQPALHHGQDPPRLRRQQRRLRQQRRHVARAAPP